MNTKEAIGIVGAVSAGLAGLMKLVFGRGRQKQITQQALSTQIWGWLQAMKDENVALRAKVAELEQEKLRLERRLSDAKRK